MLRKEEGDGMVAVEGNTDGCHAHEPFAVCHLTL